MNYGYPKIDLWISINNYGYPKLFKDIQYLIKGIGLQTL